MGTGILASAAHSLPHGSHALACIATAAWLLDLALLAIVTAFAIGTYVRRKGTLRADVLDPATAPFFGAVAMGILSAGNATMVVGSGHLGAGPAARIDAVLWVIGTVLGLLSATVVPFMAFTRHRVPSDAASPAWLLPVVAPMVSAASGALLIDHVSPAAGRNIAALCFAQFGATAMAAIFVISSVWNRLAHHQHRSPATAPSMLIVLGPLGQSVTTAGLLADHAPESLGIGRQAWLAFSLLYGIPVMGFAMLWLVIAAGIIADAARGGLPFTLGWWAFTFPVGTCVTGASVLARHSGSDAFAWLAVALYALLAAGWLAAAAGTLRMLAHTLSRALDRSSVSRAALG